jgi:hypothetical protein
MLDKKLLKILKKTPLTPKCELVFNPLGDAIKSHGVHPAPELKILGVKMGVSFSSWRKHIYEHPDFQAISDHRAAKSARFNRARLQLIVDVYIGQHDGLVWLA